MELGDLTVGGFVSGTNSLVTFDFANPSTATPNAGVIQFDNADFVGNADKGLFYGHQG